ncbi:MAG: hypothetical protein AB7E49_01485 [Campylobacterales bacterium]
MDKELTYEDVYPGVHVDYLRMLWVFLLWPPNRDENGELVDDENLPPPAELLRLKNEEGLDLSAERHEYPLAGAEIPDWPGAAENLRRVREIKLYGKEEALSRKQRRASGQNID